MKQSVRFAFYIAFAGLLCALVWLGGKNRSLEEELEIAQQSLEKERALAVSLTRERLDPLQAPVAAVPKPTTVPTPDPVVEMRKLWADPAFRAARFNDAIVQVEARYGRFFSKLVGWPPAKIEELKRRMALQQIELAQASLPRSFPVDANQQREIGEAISSTVEKNNALLKDFMGEADFAKFDQAEKSEPYRTSIDSITNAMRSKNIQVDGDLEESILSAYAAAIQQAAKQAEPVNLQALSDEQRVALRQKQLAAFRALLSTHMSGVLNEQQLNAFLESELEQSGGG